MSKLQFYLLTNNLLIFYSIFSDLVKINTVFIYYNATNRMVIKNKNRQLSKILCFQALKAVVQVKTKSI